MNWQALFTLSEIENDSALNRCEYLNIFILKQVMAHSHCTGPGPDQGPGNDGFLYYTMYCTHYTGKGAGQETIVFECANPGACPSPMQCVWAIRAILLGKWGAYRFSKLSITIYKATMCIYTERKRMRNWLFSLVFLGNLMCFSY